MNDQLVKFAKSVIKLGLKECSVDQQLIFKRMYSHLDLTKDINEVIDNIPDEKLDWAMQQIQRTLDLNEKRKLNQ
jgi:hypothetical protein